METYFRRFSPPANPPAVAFGPRSAAKMANSKIVVFPLPVGAPTSRQARARQSRKKAGTLARTHS